MGGKAAVKRGGLPPGHPGDEEPPQWPPGSGPKAPKQYQDSTPTMTSLHIVPLFIGGMAESFKNKRGNVDTL